MGSSTSKEKQEYDRLVKEFEDACHRFDKSGSDLPQMRKWIEQANIHLNSIKAITSKLKNKKEKQAVSKDGANFQARLNSMEDKVKAITDFSEKANKIREEIAEAEMLITETRTLCMYRDVENPSGLTFIRNYKRINNALVNAEDHYRNTDRWRQNIAAEDVRSSTGEKLVPVESEIQNARRLTDTLITDVFGRHVKQVDAKLDLVPKVDKDTQKEYLKQAQSFFDEARYLHEQIPRSFAGINTMKDELESKEERIKAVRASLEPVKETKKVKSKTCTIL